LAFSNGIVILSILAGVLLVTFGGDTHSLIPLYMIGVFVSFTLSQVGMVIHWRTPRGEGWRTSAAINGFGAIVTGVVLIVVATAKAFEGAWIKGALLFKPNVVVTSVPFHLGRRPYKSANRYPTQGSVRMYFGDAGLGSIFLRSEPIKTRRCSG